MQFNVWNVKNVYDCVTIGCKHSAFIRDLEIRLPSPRGYGESILGQHCPYAAGHDFQ